MNINLNEAIAVAEQRAIKWDLEVTIGARSYRIRPLAVVDLQALADLAAKEKSGDLGMAEAMAFVGSLFEGEAPDLAILSRSPELMAALIATVSVYFQEHVKKKSELLAAVVRPQVVSGLRR